MPLTQQIRDRITYALIALFYVLMVYKYLNGFFLFQLQPFIFNTRFDFLTWIVMDTGLHLSLIKKPSLCLLFDIVFYTLPLIYLIAYKINMRMAVAVAILMLPVNWLYYQVYTLFPANSIEGFTQWMLFPFLLMTVSLRTFWYVFHGLRYFFLYFFLSAGIWKLVQGGFFNYEQMTGVLLYQHKDFLTSSPNHWFSRAVYYLTAHSGISYLLYLAATFFELLFLIGFFTRKYDKVLILVFVLFLIADVVVMRIPYWEVTPFLLTLYFSKYEAPVVNTTLVAKN